MENVLRGEGCLGRGIFSGEVSFFGHEGSFSGIRDRSWRDEVLFAGHEGSFSGIRDRSRRDEVLFAGHKGSFSPRIPPAAVASRRAFHRCLACPRGE